MHNRIEVLNALLNLRKPLPEISESLIHFPWNSEESLVLEVAQIRWVLERYLSGEISESFVEDWANLIECRDDISFDEKNSNLIKRINAYVGQSILNKKVNSQSGKILNPGY